MHGEYIEQRNGGYYVARTRISLDSVVYGYNRGESPEQILEDYPLVGSLAKVYGAIAFYLDNKADIDRYLEESAREFEANTIPLSEANPGLWERLQRARAALIKFQADADVRHEIVVAVRQREPARLRLCCGQ